MAIVDLDPLLIDVHDDVPICTGDDLCVIVLSPNLPQVLLPHPHNVPSDLIPNITVGYENGVTSLNQPIETIVHDDVPICTGDDLWTRSFWPNNPSLLFPQVNKPPSDLIPAKVGGYVVLKNPFLDVI